MEKAPDSYLAVEVDVHEALATFIPTLTLMNRYPSASPPVQDHVFCTTLHGRNGKKESQEGAGPLEYTVRTPMIYSSTQHELRWANPSRS